MDPSDLNVEDLKKAEYDEFEVSGDNTVLKIFSNNSIAPFIGTLNTTTYMTPSKRSRSLIWQHFQRVDVTDSEKSY